MLTRYVSTTPWPRAPHRRAAGRGDQNYQDSQREEGCDEQVWQTSVRVEVAGVACSPACGRRYTSDTPSLSSNEMKELEIRERGNERDIQKSYASTNVSLVLLNCNRRASKVLCMIISTEAHLSFVAV